MMSLNSPGKVNLILNILAQRPDGYHDIETIFQTVTLCDHVSIEVKPSDQSQIELKVKNESSIPLDERNIAWKAAQKYLEKTAKTASVSITLEKNIPVAAGMAGGSADAAAVLTLLNRFYDNALTQSVLEKLALSIGADVPFLLRGGTALGKGVGEILTPLPTAHFTLVAAKPKNLEISAGWAYQQYAALPEKPENKDTKALRTALTENNSQLIADNLFNAFETPVYKHYPQLKELKETLIKHGCLNAILSGSGPTIFGIAPSLKEAYDIQKRLESPELSVWVAQTC